MLIDCLKKIKGFTPEEVEEMTSAYTSAVEGGASKYEASIEAVTGYHKGLVEQFKVIRPVRYKAPKKPPYTIPDEVVVEEEPVKEVVAKKPVEKRPVEKVATAPDVTTTVAKDASTQETPEPLRSVPDENFGRSDYTFKESDYRPSVVEWAKEKFGDRVAPNGKPVYQNFVKWFDKSVVVDERGHPMLMWHGTPTAGFVEFEKGKIGKRSNAKGIHFTNRKSVAATYSGTRDEYIPPTKWQDAGLTVEYDDGYGEWTVSDPDGEILEYYGTEAEARQGAQALIDTGNYQPEDPGNYAGYISLQPPVMDVDLKGGSWADAIYWNETKQEYVTQAEDYYGNNDNFEYSEEDGTYTNDEGDTLYYEAANINDLVRSAADMEDAGVLVRNVYDDGGEMGSQYTGGDSTQAIIFDSKQFKSLHNLGNFSPEEGSILRQVPNSPFYSRVESIIKDKMPTRASAAQVTALLAKNGVKELDPEFQALKVWLPERVSKEDVLAFVEANRVVVSEVVKSDRGSEVTDDEVAAWWNDEGGANEETDYADLSPNQQETARERYLAESFEWSEDNLDFGVKFAQWQVPGESENYREEFLTAPQDIYGYRVFGRGTGGSSYDSTRFENKAHAERQADALRESGYDVTVTPLIRHTWKDGHESYSDVVNPIVRVRYNSRTTTDGDKMLFGEEIQQPSKDNLAKMPKAYQKFGEEMAIRKMLYRAVEGGYDYFGFTTGQQQADRYDLSKQVESINFLTNQNTGNKYVIVIPKDGARMEFSVDPDTAKVVSSTERDAKGKGLDEIVGKDIAAKIMGERWGDLSGLDLKVGGEGLIQRYDRKHVDYINKLMKPYGVRVESKQIETASGKPPVDKWDNLRIVPDEATDEFELIARNKETGKDNVSLGYFGTRSEAEAELARYSTDRKTETVHAVRISPEFKAAVKAAMEEHGGAFPLFKQPENRADLDKLKTKYLDELAPDVKTEYKGENVVEINAEASELIRTALSIVMDTPREAQTVIGSLFTEPQNAANLIEAIDEAGLVLEEAGIDAKQVKALVKNIEKASEKDGTVIFDGGGLEHEKVHYSSWKGADGKRLVDRYANIDEIARDKDFKQFWGALNDLQGNSSIGVAAEEALAYLGSGDYARFGLTEDQAVGILQKLVTGYAEANGVESLKNFEAEKIYEAIETYRESQSSETSNDSRSEVGEEQEARSEPSKEKPDKAAEKQRSLPGTLREAGLEAQDESYKVFGNEDAIQAANDLIADLGLEKAIKTVEASTSYDKTHAVMSFMLQRALRNEAAKAEADGDTEYANTLRKRGLELASKHAELATQAGQFTQAAAMVADAVESVLYRAQKIADKRGRPLTPVEYEKFEQLGIKAENQTNDLDRLRKDIRNLKAQIKRLKEGKVRVVGTRINKKAIAEARKNLPEMSALLAQIKKDLRDANEVLRMVAKSPSNVKVFEGEDAYHEYYDHLHEAYVNVWDDFTNAKADDRQEWPQIKRNMLVRVWNDFITDGYVKEPESINYMQKKILQATAQLEVNTVLGSHGTQDPIEAMDDYAGITITEAELDKFFDKYARHTNGQWALSDYGLPKVQSLLFELLQAQTAERKLVLIDRILNVVHQRGDLAEFFVEGGTKTLNELAGEQDDGGVLRSVPADPLRAKLAQYGASTIIDKPLSQINREDFYAEMRRTFGKRVEDILPQIFAESFNLRQELLNDAKMQLASDALRADDPSLTDAEIKAKLKENEKARKERRAQGQLAKTLANLYKPAIAKQNQDVLDIVDEIADPAVSDYAEMILTKQGVGLRKDRQLYKDAMSAIRDAHKILRDEQIVIKQNIAGGESQLRDLEREEFLKRDARRTTEKDIIRSYRRLEESAPVYYGKEALKLLGESRSLLASGDLSGSLRQGFYHSMTNPLLNIKGSEKLPSSYGTMLKGLLPRGKGDFADRIIAIENHPDFDIMKQMGVEFAEAGGGVAEENVRTEYLKSVPVVKNWLNVSERTYAGFLDAQRALWAESVINELRSEGISYKDNPEVYKAAGSLINIATGRGDIGRGKLKSAVETFGGVFFAPRFVVSRVQLLGHVAGGATTLPPGLRKIELKRAARFHTVITLPMLALIAAGIVAIDPDDDDFLKIRVGPKARYEFTGGLQSYIRLIGQIGKAFYQYADGQTNEKDLRSTITRRPLKFLQQKLAPVPSYGMAALTGKEVDTTDFNWLKGITNRLTPITVREIGAGYEDGITGMLLTTPTILGIGTAYYGDSDRRNKKHGGVDGYLKSPEFKQASTDDLVDILMTEDMPDSDRGLIRNALRGKAMRAKKGGTLTQEEVNRIKKVIPDFNITANDKKGAYILNTTKGR